MNDDPEGSDPAQTKPGASAPERASIVKRSVSIQGHRTSISLEDAFWEALRRIAAKRGISLAALVREVDAGRGRGNLSSALRVFALREAERRACLPD